MKAIKTSPIFCRIITRKSFSLFLLSFHPSFSFSSHFLVISFHSFFFYTKRKINCLLFKVCILQYFHNINYIIIKFFPFLGYFFFKKNNIIMKKVIKIKVLSLILFYFKKSLLTFSTLFKNNKINIKIIKDKVL